MPALDDIEVESPQEGTCGILTHADYCALSDALEHAEYIERAPALQDEQFFYVKHPLLTQFRRAAHFRENSQPQEVVTRDPDDYKAGRSIWSRVQDKRETGGLRRAAELEARLNKAHKDFFLTKQLIAKEQAKAKRAEKKILRKRLENAYCVIDGVQYPISLAK